MDNDFFLDAGITPLLHSDQPPIPTWHSLQPVDLHFPAPVIGDASPGCYFDSALSSMVSSPASASNSAMCNEGFVIRELIGKLGNICNSGQIPTPANVPVDFAGNQVNSIRPNLPAMPGDPGFADRAARFSSFRSRSFNCRTTQFGSPDGSGFNSNSGQEQLKAGRKLQRILSSPSLKVESENDMKVNGFPGDCGVDQGQLRNSIENSSISEQNHPFAENGSASRKRKSAPKPKSKQIPSSPTKVTQSKIDPIKKRIKSSEEDDGSKKEDNKTTNEKPPEPPKDYIHVRARRGQATDSHSLAERVRREKISERMKLLQDIVPGCNKVTGKALMLEEIINYVQSLQRQVEFLSMKVASVPPTMDFNTTNPFQNDMYQPNCGMQTSSMQQFNVLTPNFYSAQQNGNAGDMSLPTTNDFINGAHRVQPLCEGDLQTIFEMGLNDNTVYTG